MERQNDPAERQGRFASSPSRLPKSALRPMQRSVTEVGAFPWRRFAVWGKPGFRDGSSRRRRAAPGKEGHALHQWCRSSPEYSNGPARSRKRESNRRETEPNERR